MIRNLKVLGLGLVAVFAFSALSASAALAQNGPGVITSTAPVTLTGKQTGAKNENSLTAFGGVVTCANATYAGHKVGTKEFLKNESSATITPSYGSCITVFSGIEFPTTVDVNGCDFVFDLGVTTGVANQYKIKATEVCPSNETIKVTVFANATKHAENKPFCVIDITKEPDRGETLTATDTLNGSIDITGTVNNIKSDRESPTGSILCPKEEDTKGILHIDVNVTGDNEAGGAEPISLSHS